MKVVELGRDSVAHSTENEDGFPIRQDAQFEKLNCQIW